MLPRDAEPLRPRSDPAQRVAVGRPTSFPPDPRGPAGRADVRHLDLRGEDHGGRDSAVKVPDDIPLDKACLVGCGVGTGWGSAINSADVRPGDVSWSSWGRYRHQRRPGRGPRRRLDGDRGRPGRAKRTKSLEPARPTPSPIEEATELAQSVTNGQAPTRRSSPSASRRASTWARRWVRSARPGTVVVTGLGNIADVGARSRLADITLFQKRIQGSLCIEPQDRRPQKLLRLTTEGHLQARRAGHAPGQAPTRSRSGYEDARRPQPAGDRLLRPGPPRATSCGWSSWGRGVEFSSAGRRHAGRQMRRPASGIRHPSHPPTVVGKTSCELVPGDQPYFRAGRRRPGLAWRPPRMTPRPASDDPAARATTPHDAPRNVSDPAAEQPPG